MRIDIANQLRAVTLLSRLNESNRRITARFYWFIQKQNRKSLISHSKSGTLLFKINLLLSLRHPECDQVEECKGKRKIV